MNDPWAASRRYDLAELLGRERAGRLLELQSRGKLSRTTEEHVEYQDLIDARNRARRARWMLEHARRLESSSASSGEDTAMDRTPESDSPGIPPAPEAEAFAVPPVSSPEPAPEPDPDGAEETPASSPGVEDVRFPMPADPPDVIAGRKTELRAHIAEFLSEWSAWIASHGVWSAPKLARRWLARIGAAAAEGYGILDHEPRREIALAVFLGGTAIAFVPVSILALRRWSIGRARGEPAAEHDQVEQEARFDA